MTPRLAAGQELRALLTPISPALRRSAAALWRREGLTARYLRYLGTMHAVVRASVPLMELAVARCRDSGTADPGLRALGRFLPCHIERELHHDDWLLRDMAAAGLDPERERSRPPTPHVARLVGAQYYWVSHHHPVSLLGYIAVLELHAPDVALADLLAEWTGLPPEAFATLRLHAEADGGHSAEVLAALDEAATTEDARHAVRLSALHTAAALVDVLDDLSAPRDPRPGPVGREGEVRP